MSYDEEFSVVDLILASPASTRAVDAFALSVIKAERQVRKLFTHLVYQFPAFGAGDISDLRQTLWNSKRVYLEGLISGFNGLYHRRIEDLVGGEHERLLLRLREAVDHRNKIFHGQLTSESLTREGLLGYVHDIRAWCERLATSGLAEVAYDGFARNSFRKSTRTDLWRAFRIQLTSVEEYAVYIRRHMARRA